MVAGLLLHPLSSEAGTSGRILGKVQSREGEGLFGAVITLLKQDKNGGNISFTRSDPHGSYAINDIAPGSYDLQVRRPGFQPLKRANITILPGRVTTLDLVLVELLDLISADDDPRNWNLGTVIKSTADRRLVFRNMAGTESGESPGSGSAPVVLADGSRMANSFYRTAVVRFSSTAGISGDTYTAYPSAGGNGIVSNFAFAEPIGDHGRMILSGQINSGYDSFWGVRNTYNYRMGPDRDVKMSLGYGRVSLNRPPTADFVRPPQFLSGDPALRESGIRTIGLGLEARNRMLDPVTVEYGLDYSRIHSGTTQSILSPSFRIIITPADRWVVSAAMSSRRLTEGNSLELPDGEYVNLSDPTFITQIDGKVSLSRIRHSELAVERSFDGLGSLEIAAYEDDVSGPGTPLLTTTIVEDDKHSRLIQLREDQASQRGLRLAVNRQILDFVSGSLAYVYSTGARLEGPDQMMPADELAQNLLNYVQRSYFHTINGELDAVIPQTRTHLTTILRWHPGNSLSSIDLFADRRDTRTKGVSFFIRQEIPLPEFMASAGRWEALVDVRNLFDQGHDSIRTTDGEFHLFRNPRSVRFGLNLNLY